MRIPGKATRTAFTTSSSILSLPFWQSYLPSTSAESACAGVLADAKNLENGDYLIFSGGLLAGLPFLWLWPI